MALQSRPYYSNSLDQSEGRRLLDKSNDHYPDIDPSIASNGHMYSLADGALQMHGDSTDRHFAGLVQAATAAAGQEASYAQENSYLATPRPSTRHSRATGAEEAPETTIIAQGNPEESALNASARKRKRQGLSTKLGQDPSPITAGSGESEEHSLQEIGSNTRLAGIQSATALFRSPSTSNKKYTRPPMSKVFTSLELSPENFLHLQAAAKAYMLDPDHPERRDCVGQRGKGDSELVKMRLWNCAAKFLDEEGHGLSHFGQDVPGADGVLRSMLWPRDRNKIIGVIIPLLRRMVTNERQRQYAVEARKGGNTGIGRRLESNSEVPSPSRSNIEYGSRDPSGIGDLRMNGLRSPPREEDRLTPSARSTIGMTHCSGSPRLCFNIVEGQHRIRPSFEALAEECPDLQAVYAKVLRHYGVATLDGAVVRVLLPQGLTSIASDEEWVRALLTVEATEWMDGETKIVIDLS